MSGKNIIKINPDIKEEAVSKKQQRFMGMVRAAQKGEGAASPEVAQVAASMKKKDVKKYAETKHDGLPEKKEVKEGMGGDCGPKDEKDEDRRDRKTYRELLKNKLRAMGIKNPMVLGDTDEKVMNCLLYTSPSPRDISGSRMPSSA